MFPHASSAIVEAFLLGAPITLPLIVELLPVIRIGFAGLELAVGFRQTAK